MAKSQGLIAALGVGIAALLVSSSGRREGSSRMFGVFPVDKSGGPYFQDTFGQPWGPGRTHEGIDIFATLGTPVYAVADGQLSSGEGDVSGKWLKIVGKGQTYFYAHLSAFERLDGAVKAGELIGYVGDTGNAKSKGYHLHFQAWNGGVLVNPYPALVESKGA